MSERYGEDGRGMGSPDVPSHVVMGGSLIKAFSKLTDAEFCESRCPVCVSARRGGKIAAFLQRLEMALTGGGCPAGRARRRKYGVAPNEPRVKQT
jgi:hypothetical protein